MRARSYHASPGKITSVGSCLPDVRTLGYPQAEKPECHAAYQRKPLTRQWKKLAARSRFVIPM